MVAAAGEDFKVRSLAMRTELAVSNHGCELTRRDGYWVVRTPDNPQYWFGHCLVFDRPPEPSDFERWMRLFSTELGDLRSRHRVFRIDSADGQAGHSAPFLKAGFTIERMHVLTADAVVPPPRVHTGIEVRPVASEAEWRAVLELDVQTAVLDQDHDDTPAHRQFRKRRVDSHHAMQEQGLGHVWGAFLGGTLVAKLGLFHVDELSRFQNIATDYAHRRRGICGTLVYEVCRQSLQARPARRLVMCAVEGYHASGIYQSVGFRVRERHVDLLRPPGMATPG
ncbi:MAG: GNAT family N-acetyltransferase [Myxococcales bacterium]|nr:GNAT family N-acetyltransferase [Myxococcales bacterium]